MFWKTIDDQVLGFCTRVSHSLQKLTGKTNFFIAKIGAGLAIINIILSSMNYFYKIFEVRTDGFMLFIDFLILIGLYENSQILDKADDRLMSSERVDLEDIHTLREMRKWRLFWLVMVILFTPIDIGQITMGKNVLASVSHMMLGIGILIFSYFVAVEPLPPGKSLVRKFLESLVPSKLAPARAGQES